MSQDRMIIYTDGACSGNPGPGGWACVVLSPEDQVYEEGGAALATTNNRMEMQAVLCGLKFILKNKQDCILYTDSTYVIRGATQWRWGWSKRGWTNAEGAEISNKDLWIEVDQLLKNIKCKIDWKYVRGHKGYAGNERCDEIAVSYSHGEKPFLYRCSLSEYPYRIEELPPDEPLPEMKSPSEKKIAYSYLSLVDGKVLRHKNWSSCEARIKGRSGAKFKKANVQSEEQNIVTLWGYSLEQITNEEN